MSTSASWACWSSFSSQCVASSYLRQSQASYSCGMATTSIARRRDLYQYGFAAASFNASLYAAISSPLIRSLLSPWALTFKPLPLQTVYMQPRHEIPFAQHYVTQHTVFRFCSPSPGCFHYPSLRPPFWDVWLPISAIDSIMRIPILGVHLPNNVK